MTPCAERAFAAVKNDAQFMFSTVHDVVLHVQRPLQMADFGGQQSGIAAGSAQQFGIIAHDIQVMGYQRHDGDKENTVEKKKGVQFFSDGNIVPGHDRNPHASQTGETDKTVF